LTVEQLTRTFSIRGTLWQRQYLAALQDVSFDLHRGTTLGIVGESGGGKSTLAKVLLRLLDASGGDVYLNGERFFRQSGAQLRSSRRNLQVVSQDPYSSLDPRMTIHEVVAEPLRISGSYSAERVNQLLAHVGLSVDSGSRRPPEF